MLINAEFWNIKPSGIHCHQRPSEIKVGQKHSLHHVGKYKVRVKGKVHPTTGHKAHKGQKRYRFTLSLASAQDGGGWSTPRPGRFTPRKDPVPTVQEAGQAPGTIWSCVENLAPHWDSIPGPTSPQRVAIPTELSRPFHSGKDNQKFQSLALQTGGSAACKQPSDVKLITRCNIQTPHSGFIF